MEEKAIIMQTQIEGFPALNECELRQVNRWSYLVDKRDGKVIYCPVRTSGRKKVYEELLYMIRYDLVVESYTPSNTNLEFKEFEGVRYRY